MYRDCRCTNAYRSHYRVAGWVGLLLLTFLASAALAEPPSSGFLYQGLLKQSDFAPTGAFDFQFAVFNALTGGGAVGSLLVFDNVMVDGGLFNVELDFGNDLFTGEALWIEVRVREGASGGSYTTLSPRQPLRLFSLNGKEAPLKTPLTGFVTVGAFSDEVTGVGTFFTEEVGPGDSILINGEIHTVSQVDSDARLYLETFHLTGALGVQAFADGSLFRVQAGDRSEKLKVDREGVKVGEQGTPITRLEHGTLGDCGSGTLLPASDGTVSFSQPFISPPRVFLSTDKSVGRCFTASTLSVSSSGFSWESWGQNNLVGAYIARQPCVCINWMAVGI